jgi:pilus assembly protein CpaD
MRKNQISAADFNSKKAATMFVSRKMAFAVLAMSMTALTSCGTPRTDNDLKTASIENDYRVRHPISLAEAEHGVEIPIGSGDYSLRAGALDAVRGFAQQYAAISTGVVQVSVPVGSINSVAARRALPAIRKALVGAGVKANRIIMASYDVASGNVSAPIRLSFVGVTAMTDQCGQWPQDLMINSMENKNWHNFGCASQNNLAAQIANPNDLFTPRGETPIDAERRAQVITDYRSNGAIAGN